jgi:superfamily II DNA/RNA helicase
LSSPPVFEQVDSDPDRKKYSMIIRSSNGSGKTFTYVIPILNSLQPGLPVCADRRMPTGKILKDEIFMPQGVILVQTALLAQQIEEEFKKIQKELVKLDKKP